MCTAGVASGGRERWWGSFTWRGGADADAALVAIHAARQGTRKAHRPASEMECQVEAIRQVATRGPQRRR